MTLIQQIVFPMTARDLVQSCRIVSIAPRGDGNQIETLEVLGVTYDQPNVLDHISDRIVVLVRGPYGGNEELRLEPDTPLLVTGISRS